MPPLAPATALSSQVPEPDSDEFAVTIEDSPSKSSPVQAVAVLINTAVGAGVLSLPYAFACAGWAGGLLVLLAVAATESFTLYVLSRWAEATNASSYGELVRRALGPAASAVLALTLVLYCFGSGVAYLVILGDTFNPVLSHVFGEAPWTSRPAVICGVGILVVLPLCLPNTLSAVAAVSAVNFVAFVAVIGAVLMRSMQSVLAVADPWAGVHAFTPSFMAAVPIAVFGLQCHAQVVAVFDELEDLTALPTLRRLAGVETPCEEEQPPAAQAGAAEERNEGDVLERQSRRRQRRRKSVKLLGMTRVIIAAIGVTAVGYAIVGVSAYFAFPTTLTSNILNSFPATDPVMQVARVVVGVLEIASYPVNHFPARAAVRDLLQQATGRPVGGRIFTIVETLVFFFSTLALALALTNLGTVFSVVGGTCGSVIILGLPGTLLLCYSWDKHQQSRQELSASLLDAESRAEAAPTAGGGLYHVWQSKLFAAGMALSLACAALFSYTIASVFMTG